MMQQSFWNNLFFVFSSCPNAPRYFVYWRDHPKAGAACVLFNRTG